MFGQARWRLTVWFAAVLALILIVICGAVFFTTRAALFDQVNDDLVARAERERQPLIQRLLQSVRGGRPARDIEIGPAFTAGGFFYAVVAENGVVIGSTANSDPQGLADSATLSASIAGGPTFVDTESSEGEKLRVYVLPVGNPDDPRFLLEVGRSTEPERQALRRLLFVLAGGGGAGALLALAGGFLLAGWALRPIETAMDRQRAFVADASHELRTPLSLIRANAEILKRERDKPVQSNIASVDDVIEETDRLSSLVGQMLTLATADAHEAARETTTLDLSALVADTVREMRLLAAPKQITLEVDAIAPAIVSGDALRLRELLTILLDNAIKYSGDGASVRVDVGSASGQALLEVSDNGPGIRPEDLPRIFDRFYRADKSRSREMGGAGLGLAIAKVIVDSHGGSISVESALSKGTTVRVELPLTR